MQLQLYIEDQRIELFEDEVIEINESIKDIREIDKLKTSFTRQFTVPASDNNNNVFKHFYNFRIVDGFDPRVRVDAELRFNGFPYRKGKVRIDGVKMKNNRPSNYRIVFFGEGVNFKDTFSNDQLDALPLLSQQNHSYGRTSVLNGLQDGYTDGALTTAETPKIIYPFITHTKGYKYNGNVVERNGSGGGDQLDWMQLKPAISFPTIIEAIEDKYDIEFEGSILDEDRFKKLYLWMHRNSGNIQSVSRVSREIIRNDYAITSGQESWDANPLEVFQTINNEFQTYEFTIEIEPVGSNTSYDIIVRNKRRSGTLFQFRNLNGTQTVNFKLEGSSLGRFVDLEILLEVNAGFSTFNSTATVIKDTQTQFFDPNFGQNVPNRTVFTATYQAIGLTAVTRMQIDLQMPKMKVIDFLNGIFKMFNLLFLLEGNKIILLTFDEWLTLGNQIDITQYIDIEDSEVKRLAPYTDINFSHEENKTFLADNFTRFFAREFGQLNFNVGTNFDGDTLDVKSGFDIMLYERMRRVSNNTNTTIGWGWSVNENQQPYIGKPLIFYNSKQTTSGFSTNNGGSTFTFTRYNRPRNSVSNLPTESILWGAENDYYSGVRMQNSLFRDFWQNYLQRLFTPQTRMLQFKAILPVDFMLNYKLNDRLKIGTFLYFINSIKFDLTTGEASIEVIPDVSLLSIPIDDRRSIGEDPITPPPPTDIIIG